MQHPGTTTLHWLYSELISNDIRRIFSLSQVIFSSRSKLHSSLVLVKGSEREANKVQEATRLLIHYMCRSMAVSVFSLYWFLLSNSRIQTRHFALHVATKYRCERTYVNVNWYFVFVSFSFFARIKSVWICNLRFHRITMTLSKAKTMRSCSASWIAPKQRFVVTWVSGDFLFSKYLPLISYYIRFDSTIRFDLAFVWAFFTRLQMDLCHIQIFLLRGFTSQDTVGL